MKDILASVSQRLGLKVFASPAGGLRGSSDDAKTTDPAEDAGDERALAGVEVSEKMEKLLEQRDGAWLSPLSSPARDGARVDTAASLSKVVERNKARR